MAVTLGGVTLNENMVWVDRYVSLQVAQSAKTTLGGRPVIYSLALTKGQPITLVATEDYGWLDLTTVQALQAMADSPGGIYSLVYGAATYSVVFRHQDAPALELAPLVYRVTPDTTTDWFIGQIKLFTV